MSDFGQNLKKAMEEKRISIAELAEQIGESSKSCNEWVAKGRMPRDPAVLKKLADVLQISVHMLLYGMEDSKNSLVNLLEKTEIHTGIYELVIRKVKQK